MTVKVWDVAEWRAEFRRAKDKDQQRLYDHMHKLTREIFAAALVRHHDMGEALMAVYLTGLYHATELQQKENANAPR